jgi:hypothetical protein
MVMTNYYENIYSTKDFETASILYAKGQFLESHHRQGGSVYFDFRNEDECQAIISDYLNDKIVIGAKSLFSAIATIRGIIRSSN